jgi:hypothetical protein
MVRKFYEETKAILSSFAFNSYVTGAKNEFGQRKVIE